MSTANTIRPVHLRRALLLFAIVLGMAALVASLSRPVEERRDDSAQAEPREPGPATASPTPAPDLPQALSFDAAENETMRLRAGDAATVEVAVEEPGSVEIPGLGLSATANPVTPARFDVLASRPGRYELLFTPGGRQPQRAGGKAGGDIGRVSALLARGRAAGRVRRVTNPTLLAQPEPSNRPRPTEQRQPVAHCPSDLAGCRTCNGTHPLRRASGPRWRRGRSLRARLARRHHRAGHLGDRRAARTSAPTPCRGQATG